MGCHLNCNVHDPAKKRRFELHEIFRGLPSVANKEKFYSSRVKPVEDSRASGIWDLMDDLLMKILTHLSPTDLIRVASTCHHVRYLAASIMPCMKLKLFPHQEAAMELMLQRERNTQLLTHPLFMNFSSEDGFTFNINTISGELVTEVAPTVRDFHGGMCCDEPGLGKTITALFLILKTQGTIADPPDGVQITWCTHNGDQQCGYYEISADDFTCKNNLTGKSVINQSVRKRQLYLDNSTLMVDLNYSSAKRTRILDLSELVVNSNESGQDKYIKSVLTSPSEPVAQVICTRRLNLIRKNLLHSYKEESSFGSKRKVGAKSNKRKCSFNVPSYNSLEQHL